MISRRFIANIFLLGCLVFLGVESTQAVRIGDTVEVNSTEMVKRFFSAFTDWGSNRDKSLDSIRIAVPTLILLGNNCGLLGSYVVARKIALVGDMLAHAVLPGIALGFLWKMEKNPVAIVIGAVVVGMIANAILQLLIKTTRLKKDAALAIVLGSFYAVGVCLMKRIETLPTASKSGLDSFWFGSASALSISDLITILITTSATVILLSLFYKTLLSTSFDRDYTVSLGLPVVWIDRLLMLLTTFAIVVAMQAVGVVLVSAMLIIPAATAYILSNRFISMLALSSLFGGLSAFFGVFISFLKTNLPTGPFLVLCASFFFGVVFLFGRKRGWVARKIRTKFRKKRIEQENSLKAIYRLLENNQFKTDSVTITDIINRTNDSKERTHSKIKSLVKSSLVFLDNDKVILTPEGYTLACKIVRNHRLWEVYLTQIANYEADHVHDDAEEIEHILGDKTVRQLERALAFPNKDPHGQPIPSLRDMMALQPGGATKESREQHGYG